MRKEKGWKIAANNILFILWELLLSADRQARK
jgi:hypothetical protein